MSPITRIGIVGVGKIARDQHIPSITSNPAFRLVAGVSRHAKIEGIANFTSIEQMLASNIEVDAVAICTPPQTHYETGRKALLAGKHVLMEKPPCTSLAQFSHLAELAARGRLCLYQTWHSQHALGVAPAKAALGSRRLRSAHVVWKEDVRHWHPGQTWIWQAGGFGVLDPGINAISILTRLIDAPMFPEQATLFVPSNCETPISADIKLRTADGAEIHMELDFLHTGTQTWDIELKTDTETIKLSAGGGVLTIGDRPVPAEAGALHSEYVSIYHRFAELLAARTSEADVRPLNLVADIFLNGKQVRVDPFIE